MKKRLKLRRLYRFIKILAKAAVLAGAAAMLLPRVFGVKPYVVLSGSMEPYIAAGSVVYIDENKDAAALSAGDVIAYHTDGGIRIVHRIMSKDVKERYMITKGDKNDAEDLYPVLFENIDGMALFSIPAVGYVVQWMRSADGMAGLIIITALFLTVELAVRKPISENKMRRGGEQTK